MNKKVYSEVLNLINLMDSKYKDKIPKKLIDDLNMNRDIFYKSEITAIPQNYDGLLKETKSIMSMIYRKYIMNTDVDLNNFEKARLRLNNKTVEKIITEDEEVKSENVQMIKYEDNIWSKIKNFIIKFLFKK